MTPSPASELMVLASTATAAAVAWISKPLLAVGSIDKDDLIGPYGALLLAVVFLVALAGYYVWKEKKAYETEKARDQERLEQIKLLVRISDDSTRAVAESAKVGKAMIDTSSEMKNSVKGFQESMEKTAQALKEMKVSVDNCHNKNNNERK